MISELSGWCSNGDRKDERLGLRGEEPWVRVGRDQENQRIKYWMAAPQATVSRCGEELSATKPGAADKVWGTAAIGFRSRVRRKRSERWVEAHCRHQTELPERALREGRSALPQGG